MDDSQKQKTSKFLSLILRHKPEEVGLSLDENGWATVTELLEKMKVTKYKPTFEQLKEIVDTDEKGRYSFNEDLSKIRANQGHSINVDLKLNPVKPPDILYHGTSDPAVDNIKKQGLKKMSRQYVHLSLDEQTAVKVGSRHGYPLILIVDAKNMYDDGYLFYLSENGVWLTERVPPKYINFF